MSKTAEKVTLELTRPAYEMLCTMINAVACGLSVEDVDISQNQGRKMADLIMSFADNKALREWKNFLRGGD